MKIPKQANKLCPKCGKHTAHKVSQAKRKAPNATHPMTRGSKKRQSLKDRGVGIGMGNKGKYSRKAISEFKMTGKKMTKKVDLRYTCNECGYVISRSQGFRAKRIEFQ